MKNYFLLLGGSLLLAGTAQAQGTFSVGPRIGLNVATAHFPDNDLNSSATSRAGFEAGLIGNVQLGHFALQPSVLFSQKGYHVSGPAFGLAIYGPAAYEETVRLNYLTVPLNLAFSLRRDGQGLQAFAGPYVGMLVGGSYTRRNYYTGISSSVPAVEFSRQIKAGSTFSDSESQYSQRFDGGLQAGVGYRFGGLLMQASYSLGLRNLAAQYQGTSGVLYDTPAYYNRAWQVSLSYLVGTRG